MKRGVDTTAACDSEAARLLPWFVTGRLSVEETARVEAHLAGCVTCRADLELQRALHETLQAEDPVEYAPHPSLQKLMTRIDELDREVSPPPAVTPTTADARGGITRWLVAALVVQTVGIALLGGLLWDRAPTGTAPSSDYRTLSSTSAPAATTAPRVRVVFAPGTDIEQVATLLRGVGARIVDGPSPAGTFAVALQAGPGGAEAVAAALHRLRADARIVFAEPIAEDAPPAR